MKSTIFGQGKSDSTRILEFRNEIQRISTWINGYNSVLPPPPLLIIFPTYKCTNPSDFSNRDYLCSNCIYRGLHSNKIHLDIRILSNLIHEAVAIGIRNIQFSGGGEPLEYIYLNELFSVLSEIRKKTPNLLLGLLTNGLFLEEKRAKKIASIFSYVRLSYSEGIGDDKNLIGRFLNNFRYLLMYGMSNSYLRIGLKLLLSHINCSTLGRQLIEIKNIIGEEYFSRLDHIRIKAMRSLNQKVEPNDQDKIYFKDQFKEIIIQGSDIFPNDIQVDLDLGYTNADFRCHLTPLFGMVDPFGHLIACYNYVDVYDELIIGRLKSNSFRQLWGTNFHRNIVRNIDTLKVCNSKKGCPCRFVKYQEVLETSKNDQVPSIPKEISVLL